MIKKQLDLLGENCFSGTEMGKVMEQAGFFSQWAHSELLDQIVLEAMVPDLPVLRMAYLIERDFSEF